MGSVEFLFNIIDLRAFLLSVFIVLTALWYLKRPRNFPPGPWSLPLVGCILTHGFSFFKNRKQMHKFLNNLALKYGNIFSLDLGVIKVVVLNRYDCIKEAFQNPHLNDRPTDIFLEELHFKAGVVMASGEAWKQLRRFAVTTLREFGIGKRSFEEQISFETVALIKAFSQHQGKPLDPQDLIVNAVSNIICSVVFGKRYEYSDETFKELLHLLHKQFELMGPGGVRLMFPPMRYLTPRKHKELADVRIQLNGFVKKIVNEHRLSHDSECPNDFIDVFLDQMELNKKEGIVSHLNEDALLTTIANLFSAATDTTSTTLLWCFLYMMGHPAIQRRVQDEIDSVVGRNRLPRLSDMPHLPYTAAAILEVQRVANTVPLTGLHRAGQSTNVCDYHIPQGTFLVSNLWAVHNDVEVWKEPSKFEPTRFLDESGKLRNRKELIPLSIGQRACLGQNLVKMELGLFFSHLLHQFTFTKPANSPPLSYEGNVGVLIVPKPYQVILTIRK